MVSSFFTDRSKSICPNCRDIQNRLSFSKDLKNMVPFSIKVKAEIKDDHAILNALNSNANAFKAFGGSPLMLTEHVENGIHAIKDRHNWKGDYNKKKMGKVEVIIDEKN